MTRPRFPAGKGILLLQQKIRISFYTLLCYNSSVKHICGKERAAMEERYTLWV